MATVISSGTSTVTSGKTLVDATIIQQGLVHVTHGGILSAATVTGGGQVHIRSGGSDKDSFYTSGGWLFVSSAGLCLNPSVTNTEVQVSAGRVFSGTFIGGKLFLWAPTNTTLAYASHTRIFSGGTLYVSNNAVASDTVMMGGTIDVKSGGSLAVSNGGTVTGVMNFANGAIVSVQEGGTVNFDISSLEPAGEAILNDLSVVTGTPSFSLTVSGMQAEGTYTLAAGAAAFDRTITVKNTAGTGLGTLAVGQSITVGDTNYTLNLTGSDLAVTVGGEPGPGPGPEPTPVLLFFEGDFDGGDRALLAVETFDETATVPTAAVTIYANGAAWGSGLALDPGWEVVGTGDFNADGKDDFLRVNTEGYVVGEMSQGDGTFAPQVLNLKNPGWSILGTGDFNGNGSDDILIANPTAASETVGLLGYWESGVTWTLINGYSAEWECVSTGDFDGDGKCDMLWKNSFEGEGGGTYNAYCTWIVENPVDWRMVSVADPSEWNFLCSGDFDGNGSHDIAMINDVGVVGIWGVTDGYLSSWSILSAVTPEWTLAGVGDFNGDGTDDIAWSNTDTGLTGYWQINDKELTTWANLATPQAVMK